MAYQCTAASDRKLAEGEQQGQAGACCCERCFPAALSNRVLWFQSTAAGYSYRPWFRLGLSRLPLTQLTTQRRAGVPGEVTSRPQRTLGVAHLQAPLWSGSSCPPPARLLVLLSRQTRHALTFTGTQARPASRLRGARFLPRRRHSFHRHTGRSAPSFTSQLQCHLSQLSMTISVWELSFPPPSFF